MARGEMKKKSDDEVLQAEAMAADDIHAGFEEAALREDTAGDSSAETSGTAGQESVNVGENLAEQLKKTEAEARETHDRLLRLAAEFENYKKRMERECQNSLKYAEESIIKELLPSIDNLERAIDLGRNSGNIQTLLDGVEMTRKALFSSLKKYGLEPVESVGRPFDPNFHEALSMEASAEVPENNVLQEFQKGYRFRDRLIRAAKVVVSKGDVQG